MSRLKCICGNSMSNTNVPSNNIINVFQEKKVKESLDKNPKISLYDYETTGDYNYEYWYCPDCKRVLVVENNPKGKVERKYKRSDYIEKVFLEDMVCFYVFTEKEIYDAEETNFEVTLNDYIKKNNESHAYYVDVNKEKVYKKQEVSKGILVYELEK